MAWSLAVIGRDVMPQAICSHSRADSMSCEVKFGLGGRRCCDDCGHDDDRRGGDHVVHHDRDVSITTMVAMSIVTIYTRPRRDFCLMA